MKHARLLVSAQLFVDAFKGEGMRSFEVVHHAIPDDAKVVDVAYIHSQRMIAIDLESETFNEMPPKAPHPPVLSVPQCRVVRPEPEATIEGAAIDDRHVHESREVYDRLKDTEANG